MAHQRIKNSRTKNPKKTNPKKTKLIYQFLSFILPFIGVSILFTGVILSFTNYTFFQKTIRQDYSNILKSAAGEIRMFINGAAQDVESLALQTGSTKPEPWQKEMALSAFLQGNPKFVSMALFLPDGFVAASGTPEKGEKRPADDPVFREALSGTPAISGVMPAAGDIPHVTVAAPVFRMGKVEEILVAEVDLKAVWDVLESITIGKTGQVYVLDARGRTIAHREIDRVVRALPGIKPDVLNAVKKADAPVEWTENQAGETGVYHLAVYVPDLDWIMVLAQPTKEIYAYLFLNLFWAVSATLAVGLMAAWLGWRWIRRFLVPIETMHRQVLEIGRGNLDQQISITEENEIGDLGKAFNDMTDSLKDYIAREVENAQALAHAKNLALLGTAASKMTHEMGNYLNNSQLALAGLKRESLSPGGENILRIIQTESGRVKAFIQQFLQFAKKPVLDLKETRLDQVIREIMDIVGPEAKKQGIDMALDWDEAIPPVAADAGLMGQVMNNLIKNSVEAVSGAGRITISGRMEGRSVVISVADTGSGMDDETLENIFEPFFTTKGSGGTGLGMPIVKSNVEAHNGTISCSSSPGRGTEFVIRLPVR